MRTEPRFPHLAADAGHYESFYIKAARPGGGLGLWLRHTVHKRPGAEPTASIWLTLFDAGSDGPLASKLTVPASELSVPDGGYIRIDGATFSPGRASGSISAGGLDAEWELSLEDAAEPFRHLPYDFLYRAPLPKTKLLSPHPAARWSGRMRIGDREVELDSWPGMVGHNWGAEHAERWVWIQGGPFDDGEPGFFDFAAGRIKVGPAQTPWVANAVLELDGERHRLGGLDRALRTKVDEAPTGCEFAAAGSGLKVSGKVGSALDNFVGWVYADPDGPEHNTVNCSISDLELTVERKGRPERRLSVSGGAAYELGMRETDHGVPIQPYPDG